MIHKPVAKLQVFIAMRIQVVVFWFVVPTLQRFILSPSPLG